jgi:hypothetical protein
VREMGEREREKCVCVCVCVCCILTDVSVRSPVRIISLNLRFISILLAHLHLGLPSEKYIKLISVPSVSGISFPTTFALNVMSPKTFLKVTLKKTGIECHCVAGYVTH